MSGVSGDFGKMTALRARLEKMAGVTDRAAISVAPRLLALVEGEFASKTDPYGGAWKADKASTYRKGTESILVRTGKMSRSYDVAPAGSKVRIRLGIFYARYHISTGRRTLPIAGRMPPGWRIVIREEAAKALEAIAGGV